MIPVALSLSLTHSRCVLSHLMFPCFSCRHQRLPVSVQHRLLLLLLRLLFCMQTHTRSERRTHDFLAISSCLVRRLLMLLLLMLLFQCIREPFRREREREGESDQDREERRMRDG